jgi:hypothetical protein
VFSLSGNRSVVREARYLEESETTMKNVIRTVALVLPLAGAIGLAMTQSSFAIVTGSENSIREHIGLPPLRDDFTVEGRPEAPTLHRPPVRHRTHDR